MRPKCYTVFASGLVSLMLSIGPRVYGAASYHPLIGFEVSPAEPQAALVSDGSGNFWGTTSYGGADNAGTIYKINTATSALTKVLDFTGLGGGNRGTGPECTLVSDGMGNLWGTTSSGGNYNYGTIFKVNIVTGVLTTAIDFTGIGSNVNRGATPSAGLVSDGAGNFWGTTYSGGFGEAGTIFKINAASGVLTTVADFGWNGVGGGNPEVALVSDGQGNLWGTTVNGGLESGGTVFEINAATNAFTTVTAFGTEVDAPRSPSAALVNDGMGNLWGTTSYGGFNGYGTVFKINIVTAAFTIVTNMDSSGTFASGAYPAAPLASDGAGYLWGTALTSGTHNAGTIFKINVTTGALTTVIGFSGGASGGYPVSGLVLDGSGNFWGATALVILG